MASPRFGTFTFGVLCVRGALLDEHQFTAIVVLALLTERENHLEGEEEFPVKILM
jgi:hypothetical protein